MISYSRLIVTMAISPAF